MNKKIIIILAASIFVLLFTCCCGLGIIGAFVDSPEGPSTDIRTQPKTQSKPKPKPLNSKKMALAEAHVLLKYSVKNKAILEYITDWDAVYNPRGEGILVRWIIEVGTINTYALWLVVDKKNIYPLNGIASNHVKGNGFPTYKDDPIWATANLPYNMGPHNTIDLIDKKNLSALNKELDKMIKDIPELRKIIEQ